MAAHPPRTWQHFAHYLRLPAPLAYAWWSALRASRWSTHVALRQGFLLHDVVVVNSQAFAHQTCSPQAMVRVLEELVTARLLTRRKATLLTEYVLACTDRDGDWTARAALPNDDGPQAA